MILHVDIVALRAMRSHFISRKKQTEETSLGGNDQIGLCFAPSAKVRRSVSYARFAVFPFS